MMPAYPFVFIDLDGTITDSGLGIMNSVQYAVRKMGYDSLSEEKLKLFIGPPLIDSFREFCGMSDEEAQNAVTCYREYYADRGIFEKTVEAICSAERIYVTGCRASSMLSWFMTYYLNLVLPNVTNVKAASSDEMFQEIIRISDNDVMIGISFPRYSHRTKTALEFAKNRGAKVISITDCENSPLVQYSDYSLFAKSDMASFVDSLIAPLSVINALIVAIGRKKKDSLAATFKDLEDIWEEYEVYEKPKG